MNNNSIDIKVIAQDMASSVLSKVSNSIGNVTNATQKVSLLDRFGSALGNIATVAGGFIASQVLTRVADGIADIFASSVQASMDLQKAMTTLSIIAPRFGVNAGKAQEAAKLLGKELRIGVSSAAEGLQNLLKSGLNLEQATTLMKRFTNEAITGKSSSISLAQAVQNLSFAYATGNSALGNMSGISENFNDIVERGAKLMGKKTASMSEAELQEAKYRGMIELTNLTMGSAEKFTGTLTDKQAQLEIQMQELKVTIGDKLNPVLAALLDKLVQSKLIDKFGEALGRINIDGIVEAINKWDTSWTTLNTNFENTKGSLTQIFNDIGVALNSLFGEEVRSLVKSVKELIEKMGILNPSPDDLERWKIFGEIMKNIAMIIGGILVGAIKLLIGYVEMLVKMLTNAVEAFNKIKKIWDNQGKLQNKLNSLSVFDIQGRANVWAEALEGRFAKGTNYAMGGSYLVGEEGPEVVNLPSGSSVTPNNQIGGKSANVTINNYNSQLDYLALSRNIGFILRTL